MELSLLPVRESKERQSLVGVSAGVADSINVVAQ